MLGFILLSGCTVLRQLQLNLVLLIRYTELLMRFFVVLNLKNTIINMMLAVAWQGGSVLFSINIKATRLYNHPKG